MSVAATLTGPSPSGMADAWADRRAAMITALLAAGADTSGLPRVPAMLCGTRAASHPQGVTVNMFEGTHPCGGASWQRQRRRQRIVVAVGGRRAAGGGAAWPRMPVPFPREAPLMHEDLPVRSCHPSSLTSAASPPPPPLCPPRCPQALPPANFP